MKRFERAFRSAATRVGSAARKTAQEYSEKILPDEPAFTTALATRIKDSLEKSTTGGISWNAKILSSHGANSEETKYGADLLGVLAMNLPGFKVTKGFLAQAKRQEPGKVLSTEKWNDLRNQCEKMLALSTDSFVFIYALNGVFVVPAISVISCIEREDLHTLHPQQLSGFYAEHFKCFIGDRTINSASPTIFDNFISRVALEIAASPTITPIQRIN